MNNVNYMIVLSATYTAAWLEGEVDGSSHVETDVQDVLQVLEFSTAWQAAAAVREIKEDASYTNVAIGFARVGQVNLGL